LLDAARLSCLRCRSPHPGFQFQPACLASGLAASQETDSGRPNKKAFPRPLRLPYFGKNARMAIKLV
jgi:hypothetical protein